jgi:hypothetical protein
VFPNTHQAEMEKVKRHWKLKDYPGFLPLLAVSQSDGWKSPEVPGCAEWLWKRQPLSRPSVSRPCVCSEAVPVRFSSWRFAAKSLPCPCLKNFLNSIPRSFSACCETLLGSVLQAGFVRPAPATGLSPAINGKHMCQVHAPRLTQPSWRLLGSHSQKGNCF